MQIIHSIDKIGEKKISLILYSLLNRIPIMIFGENEIDVDNFSAELCDLMHFRKELIYYTDFVSEIEYQNLCKNEEIDYNSQRIIIRCPSSVVLKALNNIKNFKSWVIGIEIQIKNQQKIKLIKQLMREKYFLFLSIILINNSISVELEGDNSSDINLKLERRILRKSSQDTENSIIRMKRILSQKTNTTNIDDGTMISLLDFSIEKEEIQENIFKKEIQNFFSASKRAFFILNRLNLLSTLGLDATISGKILLNTIDYQIAPIERILSFIYYEWGEGFDPLLKNGKRVKIGDHLESLWG